VTGVTPPASSDVHYTYTYEAPWDWAHRNPPNVAPSDRPYVPGCTSEPVKVPGRNGGEQVVNVTRCYCSGSLARTNKRSHKQKDRPKAVFPQSETTKTDLPPFPADHRTQPPG